MKSEMFFPCVLGKNGSFSKRKQAGLACARETLMQSIHRVKVSFTLKMLLFFSFFFLPNTVKHQNQQKISKCSFSSQHVIENF